MEETRTRRGGDVGDETVIDPPRSDAPSDTSPDGAAVAIRLTGDTDAFEMTSVVHRSAAPISGALGGSFSEPPTRILRGIEAHVELPAGSVVDDLYEIEAMIGAGAMGVVYRARHTKLGRQVALKAIAPSMGGDPQALARFEREARTLGSLHHPNIVDVYSFGTLPDERSYFTMELLLSGQTLDERLRQGRVPLDEALDILDQIARALEAAHARGIVHRDLKPSNTFVQHLPSGGRRVVLLDWGLVRLAVPDGVEQTASGAVIGTSLYCSPEQARSPAVDGRTDIYALGVVAYELVLGRHPFPHAQTATAALAAHLTEPPPPPRTIWPEIPPALDLLMHAMIAKDPTYRPTLAQVREVIVSVRSGDSSATRAATAPVARPMRFARAWLVALVAFALIVGIALGARILGDTSNRDAPAAANTNPESRADADNTVATPKGLALDGAPTVDAGNFHSSSVSDGTPRDAAVADTTGPPRSRPRNTTRATADGTSTSATIDAGGSPEEVPVPEVPPVVESTTNTPVTPPKLPGAEKPPQRYVPPTRPPRPIDRDGTINPFKRGSAAR